jgi:hypothetical protein
MQYTKTSRPINLQAENARVVSASNTVTFEPGTVYVGYTGTVTLLTVGDTTGVFYAQAGTTLPVLAKLIALTGTTATGFVILY